MSEKKNMSRRDFIRDASRAAAGITAGMAVAQAARADVFKSILPQTIVGANEKIRTGHIGIGGMGKRDLQFAMMRGDIQPIAICDLLEVNRNYGVQIVTGDTEKNYAAPSTHTYFEEVIANKNVDAVVIVTPDHWHTIPTLMACEAGKDVYVEKPLTTCIAEGRPIIDAVRKNKIVLQCGNFQRSGPHFQEAVQMIKEGYIGQVARCETWIHDYEKPEGIGNPPDEAVPTSPSYNMPVTGLDWDRYIGWTKKVPYNPNRFIYNFRWFLDYSGGKVTDWGAHLMDIVLWAMGEENKPKTVTAAGGKFVLKDNRTTPDTLDVLYEFDNYVMSFSNRVFNGYVARNRHGIAFYGTKGVLFVDRMGYEVVPDPKGDLQPKAVKDVMEADMNKAHWANFAECVRSRKDPIAFVESAYNTANICHMGTTAFVSGGKLGWDAKTEHFTGTDEAAVKKANDWAYREYQNGWSLGKPHYKDWA
jgi:predicted dehydrogenase